MTSQKRKKITRKKWRFYTTRKVLVMIAPSKKENRKGGRKDGPQGRIFFHYLTDRDVYFLVDWIVKHNHELVPTNLTYLLKGNIKMNTF